MMTYFIVLKLFSTFHFHFKNNFALYGLKIASIFDIFQ